MKNTFSPLLRWIGASVLLFGTPVWANDSAFSGVGGTPKLMRGEHSSIQMQSERVVITADAKGYNTDVDFVFRNSGGKTSVQMGFPESSYGDVSARKTSTFERFATFVDGKKVVAQRKVISQQEDAGTDAFWIKTVDFGARQTRRVRVSYRSPFGGTTMWNMHNALVYPFTGQNWRGKVERSDLEIRVTAPGLWIGLPIFDSKALPMSFEVGPKSAVFRKTWRNWEAQGDLTFGLSPAIPFWMWDRQEMKDIDGGRGWFANAKTFRIGAVPKELPTYLDAPPAFTRDGVTYVSLPHLKNRLEFFAEDLEKARGSKPKVELLWNAKTGSAVLIAGAQKQTFADQKAVLGSASRAILLHGQGSNTLYAPVDGLVKTLGVSFKADPKNRLFDLARGTWTGK